MWILRLAARRAAPSPWWHPQIRAHERLGPEERVLSGRFPVGPAPVPAGGQIWSATRITQASTVEKVTSGR